MKRRGAWHSAAPWDQINDIEKGLVYSRYVYLGSVIYLALKDLCYVDYWFTQQTSFEYNSVLSGLFIVSSWIFTAIENSASILCFIITKRGNYIASANQVHEIFPLIGLPSGLNRRLFAESVVRDAAKSNENNKRGCPLFSCVAVVTLGCVHVFCRLGRMGESPWKRYS